jgi:hypothetical protein
LKCRRSARKSWKDFTPLPPSRFLTRIRPKEK